MTAISTQYIFFSDNIHALAGVGVAPAPAPAVAPAVAPAGGFVLPAVAVAPVVVEVPLVPAFAATN